MCSTHYCYTVLIRFLENNLQKEVKGVRLERIEDGSQKLSELQLILVLKALNGYFKHLLDCNIFDDFIQPEHVLIDQNGNIKILDFSVLNFGETAFEKMINNYYDENKNLVIAPLAPEQVSALELSESLPEFDDNKLASWLIGMTLLSSSSLIDFWEFYDLENQMIDYKKIKTALNDIKDMGYSVKLVTLIKNCL